MEKKRFTWTVVLLRCKERAERVGRQEWQAALVYRLYAYCTRTAPSLPHALDTFHRLGFEAKRKRRICRAGVRPSGCLQR